MQSTTIGGKVSRINLVLALEMLAKMRNNGKTRQKFAKEQLVGSEFMHHLRLQYPAAEWESKQQWQKAFDQHCANLPQNAAPIGLIFKA